MDELQSANSEIKFKIDNYNELKKELQGLDYIFKEIQDKPLPAEKWVGFSDDEISLKVFILCNLKLLLGSKMALIIFTE